MRNTNTRRASQNNDSLSPPDRFSSQRWAGQRLSPLTGHGPIRAGCSKVNKAEATFASCLLLDRGGGSVASRRWLMDIRVSRDRPT